MRNRVRLSSLEDLALAPLKSLVGSDPTSYAPHPEERMLVFGSLVLAAGAAWTGTAQVDVMNWEGGGEHPYHTNFALAYRESAPSELRDSRGRLVGHRIVLVPESVTLKVHHEVIGLLNCKGTGEETVTGAPEAILVLPVSGETVAATGDRAVPASGAYQLVLPRAYASYACGTNQRNRGDRRAGIGQGLFYADLEFDDGQIRALEGPIRRMRGSYSYRRDRSADGSAQHLVTKEIRVSWDLRRIE